MWLVLRGAGPDFSSRMEVISGTFFFSGMPCRFDHIDLRVSDLSAARPFYEALLPALGFTRDAKVPGWLQYESGTSEAAEFFGVIEAPDHIANANRIAFWADSIADVDRLAKIVRLAGAREIEGPAYEAPEYYAVFFEDPCGNRLEICHRGHADD